MHAQQYLNEFVVNRLPDNGSLEDFYKAAAEQKEALQQLASEITHMHTDAATPADSTRTQSYEALAEEGQSIVSDMQLAASRTVRESRERRLDDIQREMEAPIEAGSDKATRIGEKLSQLERLTDNIIERM